MYSHKEYIRERYRNDPEYKKKQIELVERRKRELRQWFLKLKSTLSCEKCGEDHVACLDFYHTDPKIKESALGECWRRGWSKERVLAEIAKCKVLCSNCHRKEHWDEEQKKWMFREVG